MVTYHPGLLFLPNQEIHVKRFSRGGVVVVKIVWFSCANTRTLFKGDI